MSDPGFSNDNEFDNRMFWNQRYDENPDLGSGIGSRGANLLHKRTVIENFLKSYAPKTTLDIGCGDHEVLRDLVFPGDYLGVDVSDAVVRINRTKFPQRKFECLDFSEIVNPEAFRSEAVLCFEVIIHQHRAVSYRRLVENLIRATGRVGLVSGYIKDPRPSVKSPIIAWHESITDTLLASGAREVKTLSTSLESNCLAFVTFSV